MKDNIFKPLMAVIVMAMGTGMTMRPAAGQLTGYADESPISLTGTVESISGNEFVLDYGANDITVDMEGWDWSLNEEAQLIPGQTVTVTGAVDSSFFEGRQIKADTVYVHDRYTYYTPSTGVQPGRIPLSTMTDGSWISTMGQIKDIQGQEFTLSTTSGEMRVDTSAMPYNPLDEEGYQRLLPGDTVSVAGRIDDDLFEKREIIAQQVISMTSR